MTQRKVIASVRIEVVYKFTFLLTELIKPKPGTDATENIANEHQEYPQYIEWKGSIYKRTVPFLCVEDN